MNDNTALQLLLSQLMRSFQAQIQIHNFSREASKTHTDVSWMLELNYVEVNTDMHDQTSLGLVNP